MENQSKLKPNVGGEFNFWQDATSFAKELLPADAEKRFNEHCDARNYNWNERLFFRKLLADALEFNFTMAMLKNQSDKTTAKSKVEPEFENLK